MKHTPQGDALDRALTDLYRTDVPTGFKASWRDAVQREEKPKMKSTSFPGWLKRGALPIAAAIVLIAGAAVTGLLEQTDQAPEPVAYDTLDKMDMAYAAKTMDAMSVAGYDTDGANTYAMPQAMPASDRGTGAGENEAIDRKIIRTVSLTLATTDFERDYTAILSLAESAGGYAGSVSQYETGQKLRTAVLTLRIPAGQLDSFLGGLSGVGRVTQRYETTEDLTTQYTDTALRLQTQQDKMTRLRELLLKAEDVADLLVIESEIADTQYEIDWLESSLRGIDRQVDYASVTVSLQEAAAIDSAKAEDLSLGKRLLSGLQASLKWLGGFFENMLVFVIAAAPVLIGLAVITLIIRAMIKRNKHKHS